MQFNEFCAPLYSKNRHKSQGAFVITMLNQAGSNFWKLSSKSDRDYAAKAFRDGKLRQPLRESFNNGFNAQQVSAWFKNELNAAYQQDKLGNIMLAFGLPKGVQIDIAALAKALTEQLHEILFNPDNGAPVIPAAYEHYAATPEKPFTGMVQPLIKGDRAYVSNPPATQNYHVPFYQEIQHTWVIQNVGKASWDGRELRCTDPERSELKPQKRALPIGHVDQNKFAKLSTAIQARGFEGKFTSHWTMVDTNGENCFPNEKSIFNIVIDVVNPNLQPTAAERAV